MPSDEDNQGKKPKRRLKLGELLVQSGKIDQATLHRALEISKGGSKKIGQVLIESGKIDEKVIARTLAEQLDIPYMGLEENRPISQDVIALVPHATARKYRAVPVERTQEMLTVVFADPLEPSGIDDIRFVTAMQIRVAVGVGSEIERALERYYPLQPFAEDMAGQDLENIAGEILEKTGLEIIEREAEAKEDARDLMSMAKLPPVVRLTNAILAESVRLDASDIHIEPQKASLVVRCRVDGVMRETMRTDKSVHPPLVSRMKVVSGLDISIRRKPQDGKAQIRYGGKTFDLRISTLPTSYGEKITVRILNPEKAQLQPTDLGFSPQDLEKVIGAIQRPQGLILVTGPTGSGKSSTLYAFLNQLNTPEVNIVTVEDPVEFDVAGINQVQVQDRSGMSFAAGLRSILRQDPDIVMVGEIRDQETAQIAFQAAQTGHLVFSTLHTNDAPAAITRLLDLGVEDYHVANSLTAVIAQRLVRKIHADCKVRDTPDQVLLNGLSGIVEKPEEAVFWRGSGCPACQGWGTQGRMGIFEVFRVTPAMVQAITAKAPLDELVKIAANQGFRTMFEDGVQKALDGKTALAEVFRVTAPPDTFHKPPAQTAETQADRLSGSEIFHILVAEDNEDMARMMQRILASHGYQVTVVADGEQALEALEEHPPDLLITDYRMPKMDGMELIRTLRSRGHLQDIPVIMLTAQDEVETEVAAMGAGADDYLTKPIKAGRLRARVGRFFRQRRKILVAEDNPDSAQLLERILQGAGFAVARAGNGTEALTLVATFQPDLILTDYMMPEMDGMGLIRQLKSNPETEKIPVIMLTARDEEDAEIDAIDGGADDYIVKPVVAKKLIARVQKFFRPHDS